MAYQPTNWSRGDVITSAKLNKIEQGIASGGVLVVTDTDGTLDKTWQEIYDAAFAVIKNTNEDGIIECRVLGYVGLYETDYMVIEYIGNNAKQYITDSPNGYPVVGNTPK